MRFFVAEKRIHRHVPSLIKLPINGGARVGREDIWNYLPTRNLEYAPVKKKIKFLKISKYVWITNFLNIPMNFLNTICYDALELAYSRQKYWFLYIYTLLTLGFIRQMSLWLIDIYLLPKNCVWDSIFSTYFLHFSEKKEKTNWACAFRSTEMGKNDHTQPT